MHQTLLSILKACANRYKDASNGIIDMCSAMLLKLHYSRMSLVQNVLLVILLSGHASKQE